MRIRFANRSKINIQVVGGGFIRKLIYKGKKTTAFHPAYYVRELMKEKNISVKEFIKMSEVSKIKMLKFIKGKINLDNQIAYSLSNIFDTSINLWINLQTNYNRKLKKAIKENRGDI